MSRHSDRATNLPASAAVALITVLSGLTACDAPDYEGPQLQVPPQGFILRPTTRAPRSMFAHLEEVHHDAWVQPQPPFSTIVINGYAGTLGLEDVMAAQDSARLYAEDPETTFGAIEPLRIDGRDAWAWEERLDTPTGGTAWVAYRVVVPYDDLSYTIEFSTEDPAFKAGAPASMRAILSTFAVGETEYNWPLIALGAGLLLFAVYTLRQRSHARAERLQSINLVKIDPEKAKEQAEEEAMPAGGRAGVPSAE